MRAGVFAAIAVAAMTGMVDAQAAQGDADTLRALEDIKVVDRTLVDDLRRSPEAVTIIDASELRGRAISLEDALDRSAGIKVRSSGGLGSGTRIMIHGLEGDRVQLFIDGSPINAPKGTFNLDDIPIDVIERIEVYKGIVPARFGGDGIGGAVNIVIRDFEPDYIDLTYAAESFNTHRASWVVKKNFDRIGYRTGVGGLFNYSDNDYTFKNPYWSDDPSLADVVLTRKNDKFTSFVIAVPQKFTKLWFDEIALEPIFLMGKKDIQGIKDPYKYLTSDYWGLALEFKFEKEEFFSDNLQFEYSGLAIPLGEMHFIDTSSYRYTWEDSAINPIGVGGGEEGYGPNDSEDELKELRQRLNMTYSVNDLHDINLNCAARYAQMRFSDPLADKYATFTTSKLPAELFTLVTGLTWEANTRSRKLTNMIAAKVFYYNTSVMDDESHGSIVGMGTDVKKNNLAYFGFSEMIGWKPVSPLSLKASYQLAYKLPAHEELFGDGKLIKPSPKLQPEKANNVNVGLYFDRKDFLLMHRLRFEATGFLRFVEDMIVLAQGPMGAAYANEEKVNIRGFDADLKLDLTRWLYAYGNVTLQDVRDALEYLTGTNTPNYTYDFKVPNMPGFFYNLGVELHTANLFGVFGKRQYSKIFWDAQFVDEFFYSFEVSTLQSHRIPKSFVQHAGIHQSFLDDRFIICGEIHNIFDKEKISLYRQPLPGREFSLKVRVQLVGKE
jgi:outer membrane receptor protein involved in Fe transport